jgi:hypothetical protein
MKKEILNKIHWVENLLKENGATKEDLDNLKRWISYFQHERLIHLIVTVFVGLLDMMSIIILLLISNYATFALTVLMSTLFIFYILHYYTLENGVQKLYKLADKINALSKKSH